MFDNFDREWRFYVSEQTGDILRARLYQTPDDGGDQWRWYWEGDQMVAFYDEGFRGLRAVTESGDEARAMHAFDAVQGDQKGAGTSTCAHPLWSQYDALDRVAVRLTEHFDSRFVSVPLDRGMVLWMLAWDGDPTRAWRNEVEALWHGDVWTIEVEEYQPGMGYEGGDWVTTDCCAETWFGEDVARREYESGWPLADFPADLLVGSDQ